MTILLLIGAIAAMVAIVLTEIVWPEDSQW
jgi:hypothetical protein